VQYVAGHAADRSIGERKRNPTATGTESFAFVAVPLAGSRWHQLGTQPDEAPRVTGALDAPPLGAISSAPVVSGTPRNLPKHSLQPLCSTVMGTLYRRFSDALKCPVAEGAPSKIPRFSGQNRVTSAVLKGIVSIWQTSITTLEKQQ
jgi:hypothetical protein